MPEEHATELEDPFGVPKRLKNHPELERRGIQLSDMMRPVGVSKPLMYPALIIDYILKGHLFLSYRTSPRWVVKIPHQSWNELAIYRQLLRDPKSSKYLVPCEIIEDVHGDMISMPFLNEFLHLGSYNWSLGTAFRFLAQILEASVSLSTLESNTLLTWSIAVHRVSAQSAHCTSRYLYRQLRV